MCECVDVEKKETPIDGQTINDFEITLDNVEEVVNLCVKYDKIFNK